MRWTTAQIKDQSGRSFVVTGATAGSGSRPPASSPCTAPA